MNPKYEVGDVVYLRESAAIGHLEAVRIAAVLNKGANWIYTVNLYAGSPTAVAQYGDRIMQVNGATVYYDEGEFVSLCEALSLAEANLTLQLQKVQQQISNLCDE